MPPQDKNMPTEQSSVVARARSNEAANLRPINSLGPRQLLRDSRVLAIIEFHIEGLSVPEIQERMKERFPMFRKMRRARIRFILNHRDVRSRIQREMQVVSERERPRNIRLRTHIRDKGLQDGASAAQQKIALEAARELEGGTTGTTININGSNNNVIGGYVIKLDGEVGQPVAIVNRMETPANQLETHGHVIDHDE